MSIQTRRSRFRRLIIFLALAAAAAWSTRPLAAQPGGAGEADGVAVLGFAPVKAEDRGVVEVGILGLPMRPMRGNGIWTAVVVEIDGPSLLFDDKTPDAVSAELIVHAFDAAGTVVDTALETLRFARGEAVDRLRGSGAKVVTGMMLEPGTYRIRALVRNAATGREGSAETGLTLGNAPVLMPPIVPETADGRVVVQGHRPEHVGAAPQRPFFVRDRTFLPAVAPRTDAGRNLPLVLMGYGLAGREDEIDATVLGPDGAPIAGLELVLSPAQASRDGIDRILAVLPLPASLPRGVYRVEIEAFAGAPAGAAVTAVDFEVGAPPRQPLIAVSMPAPPPDAFAAAEAAPEEETPKISIKEVSLGYRTLLARLGETERGSLVGDLASLELAGAGGDRETGISRVVDAEMPVLKSIASRDREALVPVLMLHHDAALEHRNRRHAYLMRHSIDMLIKVADLYAPQNGSIGSRIVAARALSSLGGHFQTSGSGLGRSLFEEALRFDPVHPSALLGLAAYPEKRGGPYAEAVGYLERLVRAHPDNREARLRLAINLQRAGTNAESALGAHQARTHLRGLIDGPEADWIYVLAVQELARLQMESGELEAAIGLLDDAVARVPENQKLKILNAFCLERSGRRTEAQRVLVSVEPDRTGLDPARGRYNRWPRQALATDRQLLEEGVARRRELLVRLAQAELGGREQ